MMQFRVLFTVLWGKLLYSSLFYGVIPYAYYHFYGMNL